MNIRSLTRGDGVVIGAAVLLFIASFLNLYESSAFGSSGAPNAWDSLGTVMSLHLAGVIAAALIVLARALPQPRKIAGLDLGQFGVALAIFAAWTAFWSLTGSTVSTRAAGLILGFIAALILAGGAVATPLVPQFKGSLIPAPKPAAPQPYGGQPGGPGQGYGYPGATRSRTAPVSPSRTERASPADRSAASRASRSRVRPVSRERRPGPAGRRPRRATSRRSGSRCRWPVRCTGRTARRPRSPNWRRAPGTWRSSSAVPGLVAQTQDGRRGVLQDTTGIQRG